MCFDNKSRELRGTKAGSYLARNVFDNLFCLTRLTIFFFIYEACLNQCLLNKYLAH